MQLVLMFDRPIASALLFKKLASIHMQGIFTADLATQCSIPGSVMELAATEFRCAFGLVAHIALLPARDACPALRRIYFEVLCTLDFATAYACVACLVVSQG